MKSIWDVIKGPVITEKALMMKEEPESMGRDGNTRQLLTLKVALSATKPEIKNAVEKIFGVKVADVAIAAPAVGSLMEITATSFATAAVSVGIHEAFSAAERMSELTRG